MTLSFLKYLNIFIATHPLFFLTIGEMFMIYSTNKIVYSRSMFSILLKSKNCHYFTFIDSVFKLENISNYSYQKSSNKVPSVSDSLQKPFLS